MIDTNKADFRSNAKCKDTAPWVTHLCHFVKAFKLSSDDQSQILHDASYEILYTTNIFITSQCNDIYPGRCGKLKRSIEKLCNHVGSIVYLKFRTLKDAFFLRNTTRFFLNTGGRLTKAYDVTIPRYRKSKRKIKSSKMHILNPYTARYAFYDGLKINNLWYLRVVTS